jgi:hypothetical protein
VIYYFIFGAVIVGIIYGLTQLASGDRYANMTEEEFEAEAKRSSSMGAAIGAVQKIIDPGHRVEYVEQQNRRVEADGAEAGDQPPEDRAALDQDAKRRR